MRYLKYLGVLAVMLFCQHVDAQIFTTFIDEDALQFRVKQVDEFFVRFNYETDYKGDIPKDLSDKQLHKKNLLTLVNLDQFSNDKHEISKLANDFADYVIDNDIKIHYEDTTWYAKANGSVIYEGKKYNMVFILKTERVKDVIYKWVISDVQSTLFDRFPIEPKDSITISPADHGIGFMSLPETFNLNRKSIGTSFSKDYKRSHLSIFDYLMAIGKIKMGAITKISYFFHLHDYNFVVERIEKEKGYNQGWLINLISPNKTENHEK